jgi:hypothetical protein
MLNVIYLHTYKHYSGVDLKALCQVLLAFVHKCAMLGLKTQKKMYGLISLYTPSIRHFYWGKKPKTHYFLRKRQNPKKNVFKRLQKEHEKKRAAAGGEK